MDFLWGEELGDKVIIVLIVIGLIASYFASKPKKGNRGSSGGE